MIKLRDIYNTIVEDIQTGAVPIATQIWPFSDKASYAKAWESDRLSKVFDKSLEGMTVHPDSDLSSIVNGDDIADVITMRAGEFWYDRPVPFADLLPGWVKVKDLDNTKFDTPTITDKPTSYPERGKFIK